MTPVANEKHLDLLKQGTTKWNTWRSVSNCFPDLNRANLYDIDLREANLSHASFISANLLLADLRGANCHLADFSRAFLSGAKLNGAILRDALLSGANLEGADLTGADLTGALLDQANLSGAIFSEIELRGADLSGADLRAANLRGAKFSKINLSDAFLFLSNLEGADLRRANLKGANLTLANLTLADLSGANLQSAILIDTNVEQATLTGCSIHGISAWALKGIPKDQSNLIITRDKDPVTLIGDESTITVDNLEVAQFIYLLLHNEKIKNVIDTIGEKGVLILGRFTKKRKAVLDAIRKRLRALGYVPMMFDFERPTQRDFTETIKTLAGLSRFIIADITNPRSSPLELQATMPDYMIPFVPIIHDSEEPFAMFQDLKQKYGDWVLDVLRYDSTDNLLKVFDKAVVLPALHMSDKLLLKKAEVIRARHVRDYMPRGPAPEDDADCRTARGRGEPRRPRPLGR